MQYENTALKKIKYNWSCQAKRGLDKVETNNDCDRDLFRILLNTYNGVLTKIVEAINYLEKHSIIDV